MSFRWQFGCGCNLDKPETCYPRLLWRSIKLDDCWDQLTRIGNLTGTGLLLIRLDGPPEIKPLYRGDDPSPYSNDQIGISALKEEYGQEARKIEYEYTQGLYDKFGRLLNFDGNDLEADTVLTPMKIQHFYFYSTTLQDAGVKTGSRIKHYAFNKYTTTFWSTENLEEPMSFLVETFYIPPRMSYLGFIFGSLKERWGNTNLMVVKCCETPATYLRTAIIGQPDPTRLTLRPLNMVSEIRTGRAEWGRELEFELIKDRSKGEFTYSHSGDQGVITYVPPPDINAEKVDDTGYVETFFNYIKRRWSFDNILFYETYTCTNDAFDINNELFKIVNEDDSCTVSFANTTDANHVKTGFVSYVGAIETGKGKGKERFIRERYQSGYSIDELIDVNYKYTPFKKFYEYDYPVKWWGYHIYKNGWHNSNLVTTSSGARFACGAFANDPNRLNNPYRLNKSFAENNYPKLEAPSDFFTYNNIRVRITLDYILEKIYVIGLGTGIDITGEVTLSELLLRLERNKRKVFGNLILQSPVVVGVNEMKLNWKRSPYYSPLGRPIFDENGEISSREGYPSYSYGWNSHIPSVKTRYKPTGSSKIVISPDWGLSTWFDTNVDVGMKDNLFYSENYLFYTTFSKKVPVKQDYFQSQLQDTSCEVRVVCTKDQDAFDSDDVSQEDEILNDIKENIVEWIDLKKETFRYKRPIQCWTDNVFCVDFKQQFFDENGTKINLVESKPE